LLPVSEIPKRCPSIALSGLASEGATHDISALNGRLIQTSKKARCLHLARPKVSPYRYLFPAAFETLFDPPAGLDFIGTFSGPRRFAQRAKEEDAMWIAVFASTLSLALCFCVVATLMQPKSDQSQALGR